MEPLKLGEWIEANPVPPGMIWKSAAEAQFYAFRRLSDFHPNAVVVEVHHSKSIRLPVVKFQGIHRFALVRCNFYDINLYFEGEAPFSFSEALWQKVSPKSSGTAFAEGISSFLGRSFGALPAYVHKSDRGSSIIAVDVDWTLLREMLAEVLS